MRLSPRTFLMSLAATMILSGCATKAASKFGKYDHAYDLLTNCTAKGQNISLTPHCREAALELFEGFWAKDPQATAAFDAYRGHSGPLTRAEEARGHLLLMLKELEQLKAKHPYGL